MLNLKRIVNFSIILLFIILATTVHAEPIIIEAQNMSIKNCANGSALVDGYRCLGPGYLAETVTFTGTTAHLDIIARGDYAGGAWPIMEIRLNQNALQSVDVDSATWKTFSVNIPVTAGIHELAFAFINDYYQAPDDRNFYLSKVTITQETIPMGKVTLQWDANTEPQLKGYKIYYGKKSRFDPTLDPTAITDTIKQKKCGSSESCIRSFEDYCRCVGSTYGKVYTDEDTKFKSAPWSLLKMNLIKTPNADKGLTATKDYLVFNINEAGLVYVAYDEQFSIPAWMSNFTEVKCKKVCTDTTCYKIYSHNYGTDSNLQVNMGANSAQGPQNFFVLTNLNITNLPSKFQKDILDYTCVLEEPDKKDLLCDFDYFPYDEVVDVKNVTTHTLELPEGHYYLAASAYGDYSEDCGSKNLEGKFSIELEHTIDSNIEVKQPLNFRWKNKP